MPSYSFNDGIVRTSYSSTFGDPISGISYSISETESRPSFRFQSIYGLDTGLYNERDWKEWEDWGLLKWGETDPSTVGYGLDWEDFD